MSRRGVSPTAAIGAGEKVPICRVRYEPGRTSRGTRPRNRAGYIHLKVPDEMTIEAETKALTETTWSPPNTCDDLVLGEAGGVQHVAK
jgi:hypothetical protein